MHRGVLYLPARASVRVLGCPPLLPRGSDTSQAGVTLSKQDQAVLWGWAGWTGSVWG